MEENKEIKKAMNELEEMSEDEELRRLAELKEKAIIDENLAKIYNREYGRKEGIKEGIKEMVKKMKAEKIPIEKIIKITELTEEEINKIK